MERRTVYPELGPEEKGKARKDLEPVETGSVPPAPAPSPPRQLGQGSGGSPKKLTKQRAMKLLELLPTKSDTGTSASVSTGTLPCRKAVPKTEPCYLFKLEITTEHQKGDDPPKPPAPPDRSALLSETHDLEMELEDLHKQFKDRIGGGSGAKDLKQQRARKQKQLLEKMVQLSAVASPQKPEERKDKPRKFTVVAHRPRGWKLALRPAEQQLFALRSRLRLKMAEWEQIHQLHETRRKEAGQFFNELQKAEAKNAQSRGEAERLVRTLIQKGDAQTELDRRLEERVKARREMDAITSRPRPSTEAARIAEIAEINRLGATIHGLDEELESVPDAEKRLGWMDQLLTARETAQDANASEVVRRKARQKATLLTKKLHDKLPEKDRDKLLEQLRKASGKASARQIERDTQVRNLDRIWQDQERLRKQLESINDDIADLVNEINEVETGILALRNILPSGDEEPIEITAGTDTPWYKHFGASVTTTDRWKSSAAVVEDPVRVTVAVDSDTDLPGWDGPFGPGAIQHCSASGTDGVAAGKEHPYLEITGGKEDIVKARASTRQFRALQKEQFDDRLAGPGMIPGVSLWNQCLRVIRTVRAVFGSQPKLREFVINATTCGRNTKPEEDVGATLSKKVIVYPSDSFEIVIKSNAFAGIGYAHEQKLADASQPQSETGQLQPESSGSKHEVTVSDSTTTSSLWGLSSQTVTTGTIKGTGDPSSDKDLRFTTVTKVSGLETDQTTNMQGTFAGQAYAGTSHVATHGDGTGNVASGGAVSVSETGVISVDGNTVPSRFDTSDTTKLTRVPPFPSSWFPVCPVDISFKRNGMEDEFTQRIKQIVAIIVFVVRQAANVTARLNNWVPALGWKVTFSCDFLAGSLSVYRQYREHIDRRVFLYTKGELDLKCFLIKVGVFGGAWFELLFLEFKAGVEVTIDGYVGVKGAISSTHPDAVFSANVGFGNTGGIGATAEIKVIIGSAEWCRVAAGLTSGFDIEGMTWVKHEEGPHMEIGIKFRGVKLYVTAFLILVGSWEFSHYFLKQNDALWSKRLPPEPDTPDPSDLLEDQSEEIDQNNQRMREEAEMAEESVSE
jgi:hypothetical protein